MAKKEENIIEPQSTFPYVCKPTERMDWVQNCEAKGWVVRGDIKHNRYVAILKTQELNENGEIIDIPDNSFEEQKQTQIEINSEKCRLAIYKFLGVDNDEDAKIKQLNMLLEEATKGKNATKALKEYQETKEKYREINKELKEKINNAKTIDEIKSYDFDEKIKEIGEIGDL